MTGKTLSAIKLYFRTIFYKPLFTVITITVNIMSIAMICLICTFNEAEFGRMSEFIFVPYAMFSYSGVFAAITTLSKFYMSTPLHEDIIKKVQPVISIVKCLFVTALIVIFGNIGISNGNTTVEGFSDVLIVSAWSMFFIIISASMHPGIRLIVTMLSNLIPFFLFPVLFRVFDNGNPTMGFGLSLETSALIFAVTFIAGSVLSFVIAVICYKRRKPAPATVQSKI